MKSKLSYFLCTLILIASALYCPRWERNGGESSLGWDVSGYYWYLPSVFIYHDLKEQKFKDSILQKYQFTGTEFQQGSQLPNGNYVLKYSLGMAIMYVPFFAVAHIIAPFTDYPADGFSQPYQMAISFGSLLIAFIGLWYFRKLLLRYYSDATVAIILFLLVAGSNYLNYSAIDSGLSHNWLFTVYIFILLATDNFHKTYQTKYAVYIGLLCGLATIARPTEFISLLIPLLWEMNSVSVSSIKQRLSFFKTNFSKIIGAAVCFIAVAAIQLIYWKYVSGHWLVYSYNDQGFSWLHPHIWDYTLSYRSGWITYTPLVIFFFIAIIPFIKYGKNKIALISFFFLNWYIVSAWDIWWYAGTGGRAMIQSYPILFFILASFIEYILSRKWAFAISLPFLLLFTYINIWFTIQAHGGAGLYDSESMNKAYYWKVIGRWHVNTDVEKLKETDAIFEGEPTSMQMLYQDTATQCLSKEIQYGKTHRIAFNNMQKADWIRAEAHYSIPIKEWNKWKMTILTLKMKSQDSIVKENYIRLQRFLGDGDSKDIYLDVKIPKTPIDSILIEHWNDDGDKTICISDVRLFSFKE